MYELYYHASHYPTYVVVRSVAEDLYYLVPLIPGGWSQRTVYRSYLTALTRVKPAEARVQMATLGVPHE